MSIKIRKPQKKDFEQCLELMKILGPRYVINPNDQEAVKLFERYMAYEDKLGFIAVNEKDDVVGCLFVEIANMFCVTYQQGRGEGMVVSPNYRRQGIADLMLKTMLTELKNRGVLHFVVRAPYGWGSYEMYQNKEGYHERGGYFYYDLNPIKEEVE